MFTGHENTSKSAAHFFVVATSLQPSIKIPYNFRVLLVYKFGNGKLGIPHYQKDIDLDAFKYRGCYLDPRKSKKWTHKITKSRISLITLFA
jgi:hypothetical protein